MATEQEQINELRARLDKLERERWTGPPRLGPQPPTAEAVAAGVQRIADRLVESVKHEHETDRDGRQICTTSGDAPSKVRAEQTNNTGQHKAYIVLCEEERQKGFVRPYRDAYKHVGQKVCGKQMDSQQRVCLMDPGHETPCGVAVGPSPKGCGKVTTMGRALSETYARDPGFYGATFCVHCNAHFPVDQFTWSADGAQVGS